MKKVLVLGHGRHGKDTVAEIFERFINIRFCSSSWAACEIFVYNALKKVLGYGSLKECFEDRHNHRELWFYLINAYNLNDEARLTKDILAVNDMYVGMRSQEQYDVSKHLFDLVLWVDASERVDYVDPTMTIKFNPEEMIRIDNNGDMNDLMQQVLEVIQCQMQNVEEC